ncbi:hypothetical protein AB0269_13150 [Microbacterium sp. NPDC077644]|uniref:hypothetical protein n=1 Tax=Microbacterium sp. NPDC077644 TaxID=3155055 RepID=UPI0034507E51
MNDSDLDDLLTAAIAPLPTATLREATSLVEATKPSRLRRGQRRRPRWVIPVVVVGSLALTGAASMTVAQLSGWPWVELPEGYLRSHRIPVEYTTADGHSESCGAYVELRNADQADIAALNDEIDSRDWTGFGQQLYERGTPVDEDPGSETRVGNELYPELVAMTKTAIPGVLDLEESMHVAVGDPDGPVSIGAMGLSCRVDEK